LGLQWLTNILHPRDYPKDIEKETVDFIKLFFQHDLTREDARKLLEM